MWRYCCDVFDYLALGAIVLGASNTLSPNPDSSEVGQTDDDVEIEVCNADGQIMSQFSRQTRAGERERGAGVPTMPSSRPRLPQETQATGFCLETGPTVTASAPPEPGGSSTEPHWPARLGSIGLERRLNRQPGGGGAVRARRAEPAD